MVRMHRSVDVSTGDVVETPYTSEEEAAADALAASQPTDDQLDTQALNDALTQPGSVTRAMGELLFKVMKGVEPIPQASLTKTQFVQKLKALMRNGS
jgi:hypothetical protein